MRRIEREKETVGQMISIYCRGKEGNECLCESCRELLDYARSRLDRCVFADNKPSCRTCPVHCYSPSMRLRIAAVMRYAGPRMLFKHPLAALRHLWRERMSPHSRR